MTLQLIIEISFFCVNRDRYTPLYYILLLIREIKIEQNIKAEMSIYLYIMKAKEKSSSSKEGSICFGHQIRRCPKVRLAHNKELGTSVLFGGTANSSGVHLATVPSSRKISHGKKVNKE